MHVTVATGGTNPCSALPVDAVEQADGEARVRPVAPHRVARPVAARQLDADSPLNGAASRKRRTAVHDVLGAIGCIATDQPAGCARVSGGNSASAAASRRR